MKKLFWVVLGWLSLGIVMAGTMPVVPVSPNATHFSVKLPANATTGYRWDVTKFNKKWLVLKDQSYQAKRSAMIGGGGEAIFNFAIISKTHPKEIPIWFTYHRPWEKKALKPTKVLVIFTNIK